jgi:glycosyltransferase involved in cell wall biosynthesis
MATAAGVVVFVANSENVRRRIWKSYRREATVIYPPVAVEAFRWEPSEGYYLIVSELVMDKQIALAVRVLGRTGRRLVIVGDGPERARLERMATGAVEFAGRVDDAGLRTLYARCRALLMPGEEDLGIVTVEALASGKPVVALGRDGVLEIATAPYAGFFFLDATEAALEGALAQFEAAEGGIDRTVLQASAARFSEAAFAEKIGAFVAASLPTTP